jgi:DNA-3-methyladenine glycosylase I
VKDILRGEDGITRCRWAGSDPLYLAYHDEEWGRPLHGDDALFEMLTLEGFQAGLSWLTILRKREAFRSAFAGFRIADVAAFGEDDVQRLMGDAGIVRNRAKIEAAVGNARAALEVGPGGLTELLWSYAPPARPRRLESLEEITKQTAE